MPQQRGDAPFERAWAKIPVATEQVFMQLKQRHTPFVIAFLANWCGYTKSLVPELAKVVEQAGVPIVALHNGDALEAELRKALHVEGYPTLIMYIPGNRGTLETYRGPRTAEGIQDWIESHYSPAPRARRINDLYIKK
jgi:thioredoxin-like negative regulator of GroEL